MEKQDNNSINRNNQCQTLDASSKTNPLQPSFYRKNYAKTARIVVCHHLRKCGYFQTELFLLLDMNTSLSEKLFQMHIFDTSIFQNIFSYIYNKTAAYKTKPRPFLLILLPCLQSCIEYLIYSFKLNFVRHFSKHIKCFHFVYNCRVFLPVTYK